MKHPTSFLHSPVFHGATRECGNYSTEYLKCKGATYMDNVEYLKTINELSGTIRQLSEEKDTGSKADKKIIKNLIIALCVSWIMFIAYLSFSNYNAYNYKGSISNTITNTNKEIEVK